MIEQTNQKYPMYFYFKYNITSINTKGMWEVKCAYVHLTYNNKTSDLSPTLPFLKGRVTRKTGLDVRCSNFIDI